MAFFAWAAADESILPFVEKYCLECHDKSTSKGDREFESLGVPLKTWHDLITAKEMIDSVTLREMPPKKADQPTDEERIALVRGLREGIQLARSRIGRETTSRTVLRRLSNREYQNTIEVLFGRNIDTLGLTADFPKDKTSEHLDTTGASLVTSGFLLDQYFQAANRLVESRLGRPVLASQTWHFDKNFVQYEELSGSHKAAFNYRYLNLYEQPDTDTRQGGYGHIEDFLKGVPVSGLYDIEVLAQAMHRDTHYDPAIFKIDFSEPFQLAVVPGDVTKGHIHYPQPIEPILGQSVVPDEKPEWLKFQVWLEGGQTPRFIFPNGPYESRASVLEINKRYKDEFKSKIPSSGVSRGHILKEGALPHIRISEVKVHGPLLEPGGGKEERAIFGPDGFQPDRALDQLFSFAERAFRRPLETADRAQIEKIYQKRLSEKAPPRQATLDTLKMILCSPSFIYLSEITPDNDTKLRPYDLASRLSYALWAAPPDAELLSAAKSGALVKKREELRRQTGRMLADPRSDGFISAFIDSWLGLRDLGNQPPPRQNSREYYAENLPASMKEEARLFFRDLLESNGGVSAFLDSRYTFVDKKLAKLYQMPEKDQMRIADGFKKVSLEGNSRRGGVLGMAGVLTVSANGVETSPVTRGVWVSENLLGIKPPPPPDVVPLIEPDVTGATSIRDRLDKHSNDVTCAECHRKIDPLGFVLESFDPVGRWRTQYPKPSGSKAPAVKIDVSGEFPSGEKYRDFADFKKILLSSRQELFTRHLVSKFLAYATGRQMESSDTFEIDDIVADLQKDNYGLRSLLLKCLESEIFTSR